MVNGSKTMQIKNAFEFVWDMSGFLTDFRDAFFSVEPTDWLTDGRLTSDPRNFTRCTIQQVKFLSAVTFQNSLKFSDERYLFPDVRLKTHVMILTNKD